MRTSITTFALSCVALAATRGAIAADAGSSCNFSMQMEMPAAFRASVPTPQRSMTMNGTAWQAGGKARINTTAAGRTGHVLLVTPAAVYTLDPAHKQAFMKPMTPALHDKMFLGFPLLFLSPMNPAARWKGAKKIGTETLHGTVCDIWRINLPGGPRQVASIWLPRSKGDSYPLRAAISVPTPQYVNGKLSADGPPMLCTVTASNVTHRTVISESQFAMPTGYVVQSSPLQSGNTRRAASAAPPPARRLK